MCWPMVGKVFSCWLGLTFGRVALLLGILDSCFKLVLIHVNIVSIVFAVVQPLAICSCVVVRPINACL